MKKLSFKELENVKVPVMLENLSNDDYVVQNEWGLVELVYKKDRWKCSVWYFGVETPDEPLVDRYGIDWVAFIPDENELFG